MTEAADTAAALFERIAPILMDDAQIAHGRMFGSDALKVGTKVFAMVVKGALVVKLPREQVEELVTAGEGEPFDPGHGRIMREWVAVAPSSEERWLELAHSARAYISSAR